MENSCTVHPTVKLFIVRNIISLIKFSASLHWQDLLNLWSISKSVEFLILIPRYDCFGVTYVSR